MKNLRDIFRLHTFAYAGIDRPSLTSIYLRSSDESLVATASDGHRLIRWTGPSIDTEWRDLKIPARVAKKALAGATKTTSFDLSVRLDRAGEAYEGEITRIDDDGSKAGFPFECSDIPAFPNIARAIPSKIDNGDGDGDACDSFWSLNLQYIADFARYLKQRRIEPRVRMQAPESEISPVRMDVDDPENDASITYIVMPCRP